MTGEDRREWLQGQATNDLRALAAGQRTSFCFCEPTGQTLAVIDAWETGDRILLTTAADRAAAVLDRVERMTILEDVEACLTDLQIVSVQGPTASEDLGRLLDLSQTKSAYGRSVAWVCPSDRTGCGGWDVWLSPEESERLRAAFPPALPQAVEIARIEAGIPAWGADVGPKTLPPELGDAFEARHVSYAKGCYTGQEVLMRMHSRGHTNKTWVGLVAAHPLALGEEVSLAGKVVGIVTSSAISPRYGPIGAGMLRNEATEEGMQVQVGGVEAVVRRMPILRPA